jgi:acyl carrier protein
MDNRDITSPEVLVSTFIGKFIKMPALDHEVDIFASGYVNSLFAMQLVTFIEKTFAIRVETADLDLANFRTVKAICALVARKRNVA